MPKINMPVGAERIIESLTKHGFEAYAVGGCVRDSLLGYCPKDWDICTSATPEAIKELHSRTIDTGLKHGTVSVIESDGIYEVTTFRVDGEYSDNRRPDTVEFVTDLKTDLSRRDFTVNAMAYNDEAGVIDYYGGLSDLTDSMRMRCGFYGQFVFRLYTVSQSITIQQKPFTIRRRCSKTSQANESGASCAKQLSSGREQRMFSWSIPT